MLELKDVIKHYEVGDLVVEALKGVTLSFRKNEFVSILGPSGCGKTTLLNIIAGKEPYEEGLITCKNDLRIAYLEQNPTYPPHYTVLEAFCSVPNEMANLIARYEALLAQGDEVYQTEEYQQVLTQMDLHKAWEYEQRAKQILSKLNITDFGQKVGTLSGGQLKRLALANALISEPDLLILDEPTNHDRMVRRVPKQVFVNLAYGNAR